MTRVVDSSPVFNVLCRFIKKTDYSSYTSVMRSMAVLSSSLVRGASGSRIPAKPHMPSAYLHCRRQSRRSLRHHYEYNRVAKLASKRFCIGEWAQPRIASSATNEGKSAIKAIMFDDPSPSRPIRSQRIRCVAFL